MVNNNGSIYTARFGLWRADRDLACSDLQNLDRQTKMTRWQCPLCRRSKFDRPRQSHRCIGGFRKKLLPFVKVETK